MRYFLLTLLSIIIQNSLAQILISGTVSDPDANAINGVNISYKKVGETSLLGFTRSNNDGKFDLNIKNSELDSIQLDFNHLSFAKLSVTVPNRNGEYKYTLSPQVREIKEVKVSNIPVFRRKDTLNFNVEAFTAKENRVIGDIIRKLPGIEMQGDQILYQGQPIQKYMVNNLDLMEGRYGIINKNLPLDVVKNIQVIENDQPVKILDSLVFSDRASLNLQLKRFTVSGSGKVGAGLSPALWDVNITPMTFGKTFQMVNSLQSNNIGYDAASELRPYYTGGNYFYHDTSIESISPYTSIQDVQSPSFSQNKWLNNKIFLLSTNMLQKLENDIELKGNLSYYDDTQKRTGRTFTQFFGTDQIIANSEAVDNNFRINALEAGLLVEKNERDIYLRNNFKYRKRWNSDKGQLLFNGAERIDQKGIYSDEALLNSLSFARFIGKQLVNIKSKLEWHRAPQNLSIVPGQMSDILNNGQEYERLVQTVDLTTFKTENGISFTRRFKSWSFSPEVSLAYHSSKLLSDIRITDEENDQRKLGDGFLNDTRTSQLTISLGSRFVYERNRWKLQFTLPYNAHYYNVWQHSERTLSNNVRNTFTPNVRSRYSFNNNDELNLNVEGGRKYDGLKNFYNSYILQNYRSLGRYDARLLGSNIFRLEGNYRYKNLLLANFANLSYSFSLQDLDYLFRNAINESGMVTTDIVDGKNRILQHDFSGGVSRFFSDIKTVFKVNVSSGFGETGYLLNGGKSIQKTQRFGAGFNLINNLSEIVSGEYRINGQWLNSGLDGSPNRFKSVHINHFLDMNVYFNKKNMFIVSNSYYTNNVTGQKNQYFLDITYRYQISKWKTDIELLGHNILNNNNFIQQYTSDYQFMQTRFDLRPRQVMLSTKFRF